MNQNDGRHSLGVVVTGFVIMALNQGLNRLQKRGSPASHVCRCRPASGHTMHTPSIALVSMALGMARVVRTSERDAQVFFTELLDASVDVIKVVAASYP